MKKPTAGNITTIAEAKEASTLAFNKKQYGDLIHARRTQLGLSQAQLAHGDLPGDILVPATVVIVIAVLPLALEGILVELVHCFQRKRLGQ